MVWKLEKFRGDGAIYAICPVCNFYHPVGSMLFKEDGISQYIYCPYCGEYLYNDSEELYATWDERSIEELYNLEVRYEPKKQDT